MQTKVSSIHNPNLVLHAIICHPEVNLRTQLLAAAVLGQLCLAEALDQWNPDDLGAGGAPGPYSSAVLHEGTYEHVFGVICRGLQVFADARCIQMACNLCGSAVVMTDQCCVCCVSPCSS